MKKCVYYSNKIVTLFGNGLLPEVIEYFKRQCILIHLHLGFEFFLPFLPDNHFKSNYALLHNKFADHADDSCDGKWNLGAKFQQSQQFRMANKVHKS